MRLPQTHRPIVLTLLPILILGACVNRSSGGEPLEGTTSDQHDATMEGDWSLSAVSRPQGPASGIQMVVSIDSVRTPAVYGRLTHFISGDVGLDPTRFNRFDGTVTTDSLVSLTIGTDESPPASFSIVGVFRADTIHVTQFVLGPDTLTRGGRNWILLRKAVGR